jgi:hypothetical protein
MALLHYQSVAIHSHLQTWLEAAAATDWGALASPDPAAFVAALDMHRCLDFFDYVSTPASVCHPRLVAAAASAHGHSPLQKHP